RPTTDEVAVDNLFAGAETKIVGTTTGTTGTAGNSGATAGNSGSKSSAGGTIFVGNPAPGAQDPLRARVEAAGRTYIKPVDIAVSGYAASESKAAARALAKGLASTGVGSAQAHTSPGAVTGEIDVRLIYEAINILNNKKKLYFNELTIIPADNYNSLTIRYTVNIPDTACTKEITINLLRRIFIRAEHTIDKYAGLKQSLSDKQYVILRIAYVLFRATKVDTADAAQIENSLCKIINVSETYNHPWLNSTLSSF
ncbi:MAG: hypothetical protein II453_04240, partial [Alphaproteobacteria bacterium]|nr:hypothetical protein [Alphaproteobacteria bacterium]